MMKQIYYERMIIIVAHDANRLIGNQGELPWHIPSDLKHFKNVTNGNAIIMGRTTFEGIGRPLPNRHNIVLSTTMDETEGVFVARTPEEAVREAKRFTKDNDREDFFVIGGSQIYDTFLKQANRIIATRLWGEYQGDAYFPKLDLAEWTGSVFEELDNIKDGEYHYTVFDYRRA